MFDNPVFVYTIRDVVGLGLLVLLSVGYAGLLLAEMIQRAWLQHKVNREANKKAKAGRL
jgi:hypothetical protein